MAVRTYFLLVALSLVFSARAMAQGQEPGTHRYYDLGTLKSGVACNASSTVRTFTLPQGVAAGYALLDITISLTRVAATDVTLTCQTSKNAQTTWGDAQSCAVSAGVCTSTDASWSKAVSGNKVWPWRFNYLGDPDVRCTFACTSGGASDLVTITGYLVSL